MNGNQKQFYNFFIEKVTKEKKEEAKKIIGSNF